jgi:hypothetical protein
VASAIAWALLVDVDTGGDTDGEALLVEALLVEALLDDID